MTNIRRINLFAASGAGKSSTAALLFYRLKTLYSDLKIELVQEYVKELAWQGRAIRQPWDQLLITAEQLKREFNLLYNQNVDVVITDSPLELGSFYSIGCGATINGSIIDLVEKFNQDYLSLNIWISRNDKPFFQHGRYETEDQARNNDKRLRNVLKNLNIGFVEFSFDQQDEIFNFVRKELGI